MYPELPEWEFTVAEFTKGGYRVSAVGPLGATGEASGPDPERMLNELKRWAVGVNQSRENAK